MSRRPALIGRGGATRRRKVYRRAPRTTQRPRRPARQRDRSAAVAARSRRRRRAPARRARQLPQPAVRRPARHVRRCPRRSARHDPGPRQPTIRRPAGAETGPRAHVDSSRPGAISRLVHHLVRPAGGCSAAAVAVRAISGSDSRMSHCRGPHLRQRITWPLCCGVAIRTTTAVEAERGLRPTTHARDGGRLHSSPIPRPSSR